MDISRKQTVFLGIGAIAHKVFSTDKGKSILSDSVVFCDNDVQKQGKVVYGIKIIAFEEMLQLYKHDKVSKIVLMPLTERELLFQCIEAVVDISDIYYWDIRADIIKHIEKKHTEELHSQDGEEVFLKNFFHHKDKGVYVDVGAYHPFLYSNTYWAYLKGWRGINIEPDIINYKLMCTFRQGDININCGISDEEMQLPYYMFKETALNTFCIDEIENKENIIDKRMVPIKRLDAILEENGIRKIDFMDIDVEGMEYAHGSGN